MGIQHTPDTAATAVWVVIGENGVQLLSSETPVYYAKPETATIAVLEVKARKLDEMMANRQWQRAEGAAWRMTRYPERFWTRVERPPGHWWTYRAAECAEGEVARPVGSLTGQPYRSPWGRGDEPEWRGLNVKVVNTIGAFTAVVVLACDEPAGYEWPLTMNVDFAALHPRNKLTVR